MTQVLGYSREKRIEKFGHNRKKVQTECSGTEEYPGKECILEGEKKKKG